MGRSKEFEESEVLRKAMELFLEQGYEKTSMNDLVEHMGIHRRSMYDTFGDKHSLFMKALDVFGDYMQVVLKNEVSHAETPKQSIKFVFDRVIEGVLDNDRHWGCLFVNSAAELGARDEEVKERTEKAFAQTELFLEKLIKKGQQEGEISNVYDASTLAEYLHNALIGIRILSRNSASKEKLHRIAELSLSVLNK